ncbi:MAG: leucine-rich repeat protein [Clostridia bacterium]|nr:leucine-rich repeat protein [Clostridia bacterium]
MANNVLRQRKTVRRLGVPVAAVAVILLAIVLLLVGCTPSLPRPQNLTVNGDTLELSWRAVPNARYYRVSINGDEKSSRQNKYSLESLSAGDYTIRVRAVGNEDTHGESDWSEEIEFTREAEIGLAYKLINNRTEYEVSSMGSATGSVVVPDTYRGKPVTQVGDRAFANRTQLTAISLGGNITRIGDQAFYNCSFLTAANVPENVTYIGEKAFQGCRVLDSDIVIPSGVTEIPSSAFANCRSLVNITFPNTLIGISDNAFINCEMLDALKLPDSLQYIGDHAFSGCTRTEEIVFGSELKTIGENAFYANTKVKFITFGDKLEDIGNYAFSNCSLILDIKLGKSVRRVGEGAFRGCTNLGTVTLDDKLESIGADAFYNTAIWNAEDSMVYIGDWFIAPKVRTQRGAIYEASLKSNMPRGIADYAFAACKNLDTLVIPNSVEIIGGFAFAGCPELTAVAIGSGVRVLGERAFTGCVKLRAAHLGEYKNGELGASSLVEIRDNAFYGCTLLATITIPDTVEKVGSWTFRNTGLFASSSGAVYADNWLVDCKPDIGGTLDVAEGTVGIAVYALQNAKFDAVNIPNSVKSIGRGAFSGCANLVSVTLPEGLKRIEDYTFYNCHMLAIDGLPVGVEYIGRSAFYKCNMLGTEKCADGDQENASFTIPAAVKEIGAFAFYGCGAEEYDEESGETKLYGARTLEIGNGVTTVGEKAFSHFVSLRSVSIGDGLKTLPTRMFYRCENLKSVKFGANVETVGERAFYGCAALEAVALPNSVAAVEKYAFYNCEGLKSLELGGVTTISDYAFGGCKSLETVVLSEKVRSLGKQAFRGTVLKSVILPATLETMDAYVFYGCNDLTVYVESDKDGEGWNTRWNASYCPTVYGATLSQDKSHVVSVTKTETNIVNVNEKVFVGPPVRDGYAFIGWATTDGGEAVYTAEELVSAPDGATLYAVWEKSAE